MNRERVKLFSIRSRVTATAPRVRSVPATARDKTAAYARMRLSVIVRDNSTCCACGRVTLRPEVDHIVPLSAGGQSSMVNLQTLCHECHAEKTAREWRKRGCFFGGDAKSFDSAAK